MHREFRPEQIEFLENIVRNYRGQEVEDTTGSDDLTIENFSDLSYQDVGGLRKVATIDDVSSQGYSLNPDRIRLGESVRVMIWWLSTS